MIVPLTGTIRKYKFVLTPKARETTLLFTQTCPVTEFAVASHLNTANSCCHHVFLRHFRFQKCLPVNSNKTTPPIRAVPFFQAHLIKFYSTYPYKKLYNLRKRNHTLLTQPLSTSTHTHHTPSAGKSRQSLVLLFSADKTPHPVNTLLY